MFSNGRKYLVAYLRLFLPWDTFFFGTANDNADSNNCCHEGITMIIALDLEKSGNNTE